MTNATGDSENSPGKTRNQGKTDSCEDTDGSLMGEHRVQSFGPTGCQFVAPQYDNHPLTPNPQEYATRGTPMNWFLSNRLNPFVLLTYEGGSFAAYMENFMWIIKRYEHFSEEDRVGFFFERLDPHTQMLAHHSPHYCTKANLKELIKTIKQLLGQEKEEESIYELFRIYSQEVAYRKHTMEQLGIGCMELYKTAPAIPLESIECLLSPIADVLEDEMYYKVFPIEEEEETTLKDVLNWLIKFGGKKNPKVYGYHQVNMGVQHPQ
ncbi:hypothetical protein HMI56_006535 [Coelomomyces lativittatus]|nr:hypothetical protein HMI56_006535 [Coelomomyces lativittatus]